MSYPKIELHVHLEGTVRAGTLLQIARRNGVALPADTEEGLAGLYEFRDFAHFLDVWLLTTGALRTDRDYRQVVTDYAAEAAAHGAVYLEGIFTPAEAVGRVDRGLLAGDVAPGGSHDAGGTVTRGRNVLGANGEVRGVNDALAGQGQPGTLGGRR